MGPRGSQAKKQNLIHLRQGLQILSQSICTKWTENISMGSWTITDLLSLFSIFVVARKAISGTWKIVLWKIAPGRLPPTLTLNLPFIKGGGGIFWRQSSRGQLYLVQFFRHTNFLSMSVFIKKNAVKRFFLFNYEVICHAPTKRYLLKIIFIKCKSGIIQQVQRLGVSFLLISVYNI